MKQVEIENRVFITRESLVDYSAIHKAACFPFTDIVEELSDYINICNRDGKLLWQRYFHVKYFDERTDKMLRAFCYRGKVEDGVQKWKLQGICEDADWSEEIEDCGQIRSWLKSELIPNDDYDWVETHNKRRAEEKAYQDELDKENKNADSNNN